MSATPVSLLERLRTPTSGAWEEFVALYTPLLYHWMTRRLRVKHEDTADLLQDVFLILLRVLPAFHYDPSKRFRAWLWTVCKRKYLELYAPQGPQPSLSPEALDDLEADNVEAWQEEEYRDHLVACALRLMRTEFHASTWQACWAVVVEGRPAAEVAAELGLSVNAVWVAKSRVLRRLREKLQGLLD